ncbi:MAG: hypothetical protein Hyperionvirus2_91 [Hyperionvirus sp.]|uniref:Leucine-rich repeat protein n=1 Tax=Hyperionvirus sp. TaxID=2487770 RepID=A0A3G5AA37_9VIRU|nr:MAG: hypothetical protein Hyperionvirus2_91 [Hyperionvirus sp.]
MRAMSSDRFYCDHIYIFICLRDLINLTKVNKFFMRKLYNHALPIVEIFDPRYGEFLVKKFKKIRFLTVHYHHNFEPKDFGYLNKYLVSVQYDHFKAVNVKDLDEMKQLRFLSSINSAAMTGKDFLRRITDSLTKLAVYSRKKLEDSDLAHLTSLEHLELTGCDGITDEVFRNKSNLTFLLICSMTSVTDDGLASLSEKLNSLSLINRSRPATGITHRGINSLKLLRELSIYSEIDLNLINLKNIERLRVIDGSVDSQMLLGLTNLKVLYLDYVSMGGAQQFSSTLTMLSLRGCKSERVRFNGLTNLVELDISDSKIRFEGVIDLVNLTAFNASNCDIDDIFLRGLTKLTKLNIAKSNVTDYGVGHLISLKHLTLNASISDFGLTWLKLQYLNMQYNTKVTEHAIWAMASLTSLDLTENVNVSGAALLSLKNLEMLRFSHSFIKFDLSLLIENGVQIVIDNVTDWIAFNRRHPSGMEAGRAIKKILPFRIIYA